MSVIRFPIFMKRAMPCSTSEGNTIIVSGTTKFAGL